MLEVGTNTMTLLQEQTHFSFWAALKSPLIIGADLQKINQSSLDVLKNRDIIAINQDKLGRAVDYLPELSIDGIHQVWAGPLGSDRNRYVILVQNYGTNVTSVTIDPKKLPGLKLNQGSPLFIRDVWASKDLGKLNNTIELRNILLDQVKVLLLSV